MAEAFGLAASIIGVIGFTLQLWDDTEEIRKGGSTISTADCAKQAAGLQAHCDRVKSLQNVESQLAEANRIKAIAIETHAVAEELARRLAKCEVPTGQKGWKRYRDVMTVLWHGMRMDADAEMRRLSALRDELQSELLVSMSSKLNLSDVRNSQGFQTLDDDVKTLTEAMLQEQGYLKKAIRNLDVSADERHKQVLTHLRKLIPAAEPVLERDINENRRRIKALVKELSDRLWFDAIPRRHYAITAAHKKTFDWIFNGQKKTTQSNTTLMEWMTVGSGLYWISGRAGTGKSSLMRFLDDDSRTKEAFQAWSGERPLVLTAFYFWNSEAAGDRTLKSLLGLYKGILFGLIQQNEEFAELLFPDHLVIGRDWSESFPSLLDLAQAFERLCTAESLPAAVGLIIDGLDEYDATSSQQMQMAEMLCRAAQSPHLKIIVSSRPEAAFEAVFRESTRLRLHELTDEDRRTYTSDKLKAVTRLGLIATETEQTQLIHLVVERSEGIFLWVNLAVMTLIQEIALSLNISRLENVVRGIPSGNEELSRVFDHMLRNRIPIEARLLGFRLIHTLHYGYSLQQKLIPWVEGPRPKHPITALLYSFFEDDITSALFMPVRALENTEATVRIEMAAEMTRKYSAGLLELRHPEEEDGTFRGLSEPKLRSLRDPEVHFLHKDVGIYLNQPETNKLIQDSLKSLDITLETNLLKCIVMMIKLYNPRGSDAFRTPFWDIWHHTEMIMRIARATEEVDLQNTVALLDETDKVMAKHYSLLPTVEMVHFEEAFTCNDSENTKPLCHWSEYFPIDRHYYRNRPGIASYKPGEGRSSSFLSFAIEQGLSGYVQVKTENYGREAIKKPGLPLLSSACGTHPICWLLADSIQPSTVRLLLDHKADPNQHFEGFTCWQTALATTRCSGAMSPSELIRLGQALELMLCAGADPFACVNWTTETRISKGNYQTEHHSRTAEELIKIAFVQLKAEEPESSYIAVRKDLPTEEDKTLIGEVGQRLLMILKEQKKRKSPWRMKIMHNMKALRGSFFAAALKAGRRS